MDVVYALNKQKRILQYGGSIFGRLKLLLVFTFLAGQVFNYKIVSDPLTVILIDACTRQGREEGQVTLMLMTGLKFPVARIHRLFRFVAYGRVMN